MCVAADPEKCQQAPKERHKLASQPTCVRLLCRTSGSLAWGLWVDAGYKHGAPTWRAEPKSGLAQQQFHPAAWAAGSQLHSRGLVYKCLPRYLYHRRHRLCGVCG